MPPPVSASRIASPPRPDHNPAFEDAKRLFVTTREQGQRPVPVTITATLRETGREAMVRRALGVRCMALQVVSTPFCDPIGERVALDLARDYSTATLKQSVAREARRLRKSSDGSKVLLGVQGVWGDKSVFESTVTWRMGNDTLHVPFPPLPAAPAAAPLPPHPPAQANPPQATMAGIGLLTATTALCLAVAAQSRWVRAAWRAGLQAVGWHGQPARQDRPAQAAPAEPGRLAGPRRIRRSSTRPAAIAPASPASAPPAPDVPARATSAERRLHWEDTVDPTDTRAFEEVVSRSSRQIIAKIEKLEASAAAGRRFEGAVARLVQESVRQKLRINHVITDGGQRLGEIDLETRTALFEITLQQDGKRAQIQKYIDQRIFNPRQKQFVFVAPNYRNAEDLAYFQTLNIRHIRTADELLKYLGA